LKVDYQVLIVFGTITIVKSFEVLQLQPQKNVQSDGIYVSVRIVGFSHV